MIGNMALLSVINDGSAPNAPNCWARIMDLHAQGLSQRQAAQRLHVLGPRWWVSRVSQFAGRARHVSVPAGHLSCSLENRHARVRDGFQNLIVYRGRLGRQWLLARPIQYQAPTLRGEQCPNHRMLRQEIALICLQSVRIDAELNIVECHNVCVGDLHLTGRPAMLRHDVHMPWHIGGAAKAAGKAKREQHGQRRPYVTDIHPYHITARKTRTHNIRLTTTINTPSTSIFHRTPGGSLLFLRQSRNVSWLRFKVDWM
jgi:hypothetical protein